MSTVLDWIYVMMYSGCGEIVNEGKEWDAAGGVPGVMVSNSHGHSDCFKVLFVHFALTLEQ